MLLKRNRPYSLLARYYDRVLPGIDPMKRHARRKMLGTALRSVRSVCELACGSGATALDFARARKRVYAVDLSPEFCRTVRERALRAGLRVEVIRADMRSFRLPGEVDLVTCEFASLNNLSHCRELPEVLRSVHRALRPGGLFYFDVNTELSLKEQFAGNHWVEGPDFKLVMRCPGLDVRTARARIDFEWFLPEGKLFRHARETVFNVAWSDREIHEALRRAGFTVLRQEDGIDVRPWFPGMKRGHDAYYLARKPPGPAVKVGGIR